jgi:signal peptidase I
MKALLRNLWREWIKPFAVLFIVITPLKSTIVDWNWVPTGSMKPTILEGDLVLVNKLAYDLKVPFTTRHLSRWGDPARGDVVVFFSPRNGERLVKRVVGLPGDTIEMRNDVVLVNGRALSYAEADPAPFRRDIFEDRHPIMAVETLGAVNHYVLALPNRPALRTFGPSVVAPGHYFVMGDSRDNSADSRFIGAIPRDAIVGRASAVIVSFDTSHYLRPRFLRFGHPLSLGTP